MSQHNTMASCRIQFHLVLLPLESKEFLLGLRVYSTLNSPRGLEQSARVFDSRRRPSQRCLPSGSWSWSPGAPHPATASPLVTCKLKTCIWFFTPEQKRRKYKYMIFFSSLKFLKNKTTTQNQVAPFIRSDRISIH